MREGLRDKIALALAKGYGMIAGDYVKHVSAATEDETELLTIEYDVETAGEALEIDGAGIRSLQARELIFLSSYLDANDVSIEPEDWFLIGDERWDLVEGEAVMERQVPIAGIHNLIIVRLRRSVESAQASSETGEFTFE